MDIFSNVFAHAVGLSALAVVLLHQALKFKWFPWGWANKYPVPTLLLLSGGASAVVVWHGTLAPQSWTDWALLVATVAVTAALTYITTIKNWAGLRQMEGSNDTPSPTPPAAQTL